MSASLARGQPVPPLPPEILRAFSQMPIVRSSKNSIILSEGDRTDSMYVLSGRVKFFVSDAGGREVVLGTAGPGEYFGEMVLTRARARLRCSLDFITLRGHHQERDAQCVGGSP
jgi:CRP-like cAMP-binding protein